MRPDKKRNKREKLSKQDFLTKLFEKYDIKTRITKKVMITGENMTFVYITFTNKKTGKSKEVATIPETIYTYTEEDL